MSKFIKINLAEDRKQASKFYTFNIQEM